MNLTIYERLAVLEYVPNAGRYADMVEVRKITELLAFTPEEIKEFDIKFSANGNVDWDTGKAITYLKDIPFTEWITETVRTAMRNKEEKGELKIGHLTLYEKLVKFYENG